MLNYFCKTGLIDVKSKKCDKIVYNMNKAPDSSGLIPCDHQYGEKCRYKFSSSGNEYETDCECSRNAEGTSYCPKDHSGNIINQLLPNLI